MSKAVLISIRPKWCELIASGRKTIEVRKTRPKLKPPFKCYIYCTKPSFEYEDFIALDNGRFVYGGGKVIGEFVCDSLMDISVPYPAYWPEFDKSCLDGTCLSIMDVHQYLGSRSGYGWHISDLVIYDEPKKLNDLMRKPCDFAASCGACNHAKWLSGHRFDGCELTVTRPPQSYFYVEDLE